jgi:hypothetical protein
MTMSTYTVGPLYAGSTRPVSLFRARLMHEMYLIRHIGVSLLLEWRLMVDQLGTLELMIDIGGPALSRHERTAFGRELATLIDGDDDLPDALPNPALLLVTTAWFCRIDLRGRS